MDIRDLVSEGGPQPAWVEYRDGAEFLLSPATAEEQQRRLLRKDGTRRPESQLKTFWTEHVTDWRGITANGRPLPFDASAIRSAYDEDASFRLWLIEESSRMDNFRGRAGTADAAGSPAGDEG